jgi:hypothetical protein
MVRFLVQTVVFWAVTPCSLVTTFSEELAVPIFRVEMKPEDINLNSHRCEN